MLQLAIWFERLTGNDPDALTSYIVSALDVLTYI